VLYKTYFGRRAEQFCTYLFDFNLEGLRCFDMTNLAYPKFQLKSSSFLIFKVKWYLSLLPFIFIILIYAGLCYFSLINQWCAF
jgi:hypothetical protein